MLRSALIALLLSLCAVALPATALASGTVSETPTQTAQTNGEVDVIAVSGSIAYIGGEFTSVRPAGALSGGVTRNGLAAIDLTTGLVTSWNPGITGARPRVNALAVSADGATIYVGGTFATLGGAARSNIGAVSAAGVVTSWNPGADGVVRALLAGPSELYAGGNFTTIAGQPRDRLAAFDLPAGGLDQAWMPTSPLIIKALAFANDGTGRVFAAGGDVSTGVFEALDPSSGALGAWADQPEAVVDALTVMGSQVFLAVGGTGGRVEGFDEATGVRQWSQVTDGDVQAITSRDGLVYAGGHFVNYCIGGTGLGLPFVCTDPLPRSKLLAFVAADGTLDDWDPDTNGVLGVFALTQLPAGIAAGGQFTRWNMAGPVPVDQQGFAELGAVIDVTPPSTPLGLWAVVASPTSVSLSWLGSDDPAGSGVDHYLITRDGTTTFTATTAGATDSGLLPGSTHTYTVAAVDRAGNVSPPSVPVTVQIPRLTAFQRCQAQSDNGATCQRCQAQSERPSQSRDGFVATSGSGRFDGCRAQFERPSQLRDGFVTTSGSGRFDGCRAQSERPSQLRDGFVTTSGSGRFDGCRAQFERPSQIRDGCVTTSGSGRFDGCRAQSERPSQRRDGLLTA